MAHQCRLAMFCVLLATGCASTGSDKARVLAKGQQTISAGIEATLATFQLGPGDPAPLPGLQLSTEYRRGMGPWDLGLRTWGLGVRGLFGAGLGVDGKFVLRETPVGVAGWNLVAKGGGGYHQVNLGGYPMHFPFVDAAFLFGYSFKGGNQMFFALRLHEQFVIGQDVNTVDLLFGGISAGYAWRIHRSVELLPQIGVIATDASFNGTIDDTERTGYAITHLSIGFVFDLGADRPNQFFRER
jgi:hypothetical protein